MRAADLAATGLVRRASSLSFGLHAWSLAYRRVGWAMRCVWWPVRSSKRMPRGIPVSPAVLVRLRAVQCVRAAAADGLGRLERQDSSSAHTERRRTGPSENTRATSRPAQNTLSVPHASLRSPPRTLSAACWSLPQLLARRRGRHSPAHAACWPSIQIRRAQRDREKPVSFTALALESVVQLHSHKTPRASAADTGTTAAPHIDSGAEACMQLQQREEGRK